MINWSFIEPSVSQFDWDTLIQDFSDYSLGQTQSWGTHKAALGWTVWRVIARDQSGAVKFAAQAFFKALKLGAGVVWVPGGPLGDLAFLDGFLCELRKQAAKQFSVKMLYVRIRPHSRFDEEKCNILKTQSFKPSSVPLSNDQTMWIRLDQDPELMLKQMSTNWRHNLKRSGKHGLRFLRWNNPNPAEMQTVYQAMQSYKDLDEQYSIQELTGLVHHFGDQLFLYRCETAEGQLIALRGCAVNGTSAWDLFAAAAPEARKVYASYGLVWELLKACQQAGVKNYDFMGVDPIGNPGVYNFKKGTGAEDVRVVGEWDWARPKLLGSVANWVIERKGAKL